MAFDWAAVPVIGTLFNSIGDAIDKNVTSDEERGKVKAALMELYVPVLTAVIELHGKSLDLQGKLAEVEAKSDSWLVKNRRPVIAIISILNVVVFVPLFKNMDSGDALQLALLVNGLDTGTRGIEKIVKVFKEKDAIK